MHNLNTNSPASFSRINSDKTIDLDTDKSSPTTPTEATTKTVILGASKTKKINQKKPGAVSTFFHSLFSGNFSGAMAVFSHTLHNISSQIHLKFLLATKPNPDKLLEQFKKDDATGNRPSAEEQLKILAQAWPILKLQTELKKGDGPFLEDFLAEYSGMPNGNLAIHNHQIPESIREFLVNFGTDFLNQHSIFDDVKNGNWIGLFKTADRDTLSQLLKLEKFPEFFGDLPNLKEFLEETIRKDENTMIETDREFPRFLLTEEAGFANEVIEGMIMNMTPDELFPEASNGKKSHF